MREEPKQLEMKHLLGKMSLKGVYLENVCIKVIVQAIEVYSPEGVGPREG